MFRSRFCIAAAIALGSIAIVNISPSPVHAASCTITGTAGNDVLTGTGGADVICGLGGNDTIDGLAGNDIIKGSDGNDTLNGGPGADTLYGNSGQDGLFGNGGDDTLNGGDGQDIINGGAGINRCVVTTIDVVAKGTCDLNPPKITKLSVITTSVDTTNGSAEVKFNFQITDDLSGIAMSLFTLQGPNGTKILGCIGDNPTGLDRYGNTSAFGKCKAATGAARNSITGNVTNGNFISTVTLPQNSALGTWKLVQVDLVDTVDNRSTLKYVGVCTAECWARPKGDYTFSTANSMTWWNISVVKFSQIGEGDSEPPKLISLKTNTPIVDATNDSFAEFTLRVTDKIGLKQQNFFTSENSISIQSPNSSITTSSCIGDALTAFGIGDTALDALATCRRVKGTAQDGTYVIRVPIAKDSPRGKYKVVAVNLEDGANNQSAELSSNFMVSFSVTGGKSDVAKPTISAVEVLTPEVSTETAAATIRLRFHMADQSGVAFRNSQFEFISPSNSGTGGLIASSNLVSGTIQRGIFEVTFTLPQFSPVGTWKLASIYVTDRVGNQKEFTARTSSNDMSFAPLLGATFQNS